MAAQLRSVLPSSSPLPGLHPPGSSFSRISGLAQHSNGTILSFVGRSLSGKPSCSSPVYASSSSPVPSSALSGSYGSLHLGQNGSDPGPELDNSGENGDGFSKIYGDDGGNSGGGDDHGNSSSSGHSNDDSVGPGGFFGAFLKGWNDRVRADPQFPFKVLMEEVVGVGACVLGDMASRPNFGLNELDFVFSTVVVGAILNFSLMYMLAPTSISASTATALPGMFASCPPGHMFEHGAYSMLDRLGTFVYKGALFAMVGFPAGLLGTTISNVLVGLRKKMDPSNEVQVKAPPTVLNAATWAIHMGLSSNLRYQVVNGLEFAMANALSPPILKASVFCTRALNNVLGGMSFVVLARLTGSQKAADANAPKEVDNPDPDPNPLTIQQEEPKVVLKETVSVVTSSKEASLTLSKEDNGAPKLEGSS